jgi:repressor LexA
MTKRQAQLLAFIRAYAVEHQNASPSYQEIAVALGLRSKSGVHRIVHGLENQGLIVRSEDLNRSIRVVAPDQIKATALLTEIVEHWSCHGTEGLGPIIARASRLVA